MKASYAWRSAVTFVIAGLFRTLPLPAASALGGWVARVIGPCLDRQKVIAENLDLAMPELSDMDRDRITVAIWDNYGRTIAEYAHLATFSRAEESDSGLITFAGLEHLEGLKANYRGAVFVGGHIGNWELTPLIGRRVGLETVVVYRPQDTPYVDRLLRRQRAIINPEMAVKKQGMKTLVLALRAGRSISMLVDQRLWQGKLLPFFGHDAQTTTLPAKLALRYNVPIVPVRCERLDGVRFKVSAYPPIMPRPGANGANGQAGEDAEIALTLAINKVLEGWIRERPDQWQWLHRRWKIRIKTKKKREPGTRP